LVGFQLDVIEEINFLYEKFRLLKNQTVTKVEDLIKAVQFFIKEILKKVAKNDST